MAYQKLSNFGRAFQDASLGLEVYSSHEEALGPFKISWAKLHYRRMNSLEGLLKAAEGQIKECRNELLKIGMLENLLIYLVELAKSCEVVSQSEKDSPSGKKAEKLPKKFSWMRKEYSELKKKQKKNEELSKKIRRSMKEIEKTSSDSSDSSKNEEKDAELDIEKEKSIMQIAQKAMDSLLETKALAVSASEFETHVDSFKGKPDYVCKYLFKYSPEKLQQLYAKRELETTFVLKIISAFESLEQEDDLGKAGQVMTTIMGLSKSRLTFSMMTKREKRRLNALLQKISKVQPLVNLSQFKKKFKLPDN